MKSKFIDSLKKGISILAPNKRSGKKEGKHCVPGPTSSFKPFENDFHIRGTHYFGDTWPINFWNSFREKNIGKHFKQIKKDGFNTIILALPWNEFHRPDSKGRTNELVFRRFQTVIEKTRLYDLKFILRVGYFWDLDPDCTTCINRHIKLLTDDDTFNEFLNYIQSVYNISKEYNNYLFSFLAWEDFWDIVTRYYHPHEVRLDYAKKSGYQDFIRDNYELAEIGQKYGEKFSSWDSVPIPAFNTPAVFCLFKFWDHVLIERIFKPVKTLIPDLSMEVRVDADPIKSLSGDIISWQDHFSTFQLPDTDVVSVYYAPFLFSQNKGETLSAKKALKNLDRLIEMVAKNSKERKIFIDQFNFFDNTPKFEHNAKIIEKDLGKFLIGAANIIKEKTHGYAIWTYRDYEWSVLYNTVFEMGLDGWEVNGIAKLIDDEDVGKIVKLSPGSAISQNVHANRVARFMSDHSRDTIVRIAAKAMKNATINIFVNNIMVGSIEPTNTFRRYDIVVEKTKEYKLRLEILGDEVELDEINLFRNIQKGSLYHTDFTEDKNIHHVRNMNDFLSKHIDFTVNIDASGMDPAYRKEIATIKKLNIKFDKNLFAKHLTTAKNNNPVFIGLHIPKCAGSTFLNNVAESLGPGKYQQLSTFSISKDRKYNFDRLVNDDLELLQERTCLDNLEVVFGHWVSQYILRCFPDREFILFTFIRDPIRRLLSHYIYDRKDRINHGLKLVSFEDFYFYQEKNWICRYITERFPSFINVPEGSSHYEKAKSVLKSFNFVCANYDFDEKIPLLCDKLGFKYIKNRLNISPTKEYEELLGSMKITMETIRNDHYDDVQLFEDYQTNNSKSSMNPFGYEKELFLNSLRNLKNDPTTDIEAFRNIYRVAVKECHQEGNLDFEINRIMKKLLFDLVKLDMLLNKP